MKRITLIPCWFLYTSGKSLRHKIGHERRSTNLRATGEWVNRKHDGPLGKTLLFIRVEGQDSRGSVIHEISA